MYIKILKCSYLGSRKNTTNNTLFYIQCAFNVHLMNIYKLQYLSRID